MNIRPIIDKDIDTILALNEQFVRVLSPLDKRRLLKLIDMAALAVVIEKGSDIAGFLLVFNAKTDYDSVNYQWFDGHFESFLYIDRVVISDQFQGQGIASMLYQFVVNFAAENEVDNIVAEIDILPPNQGSLSFHQKWGFKQIELLKHNEHKVVSLQVHKVNKSVDA
ncbi:GNAT family N-acetyltransferase [Shewanella sp. TC10]|uniref:GNAT family N-acetyltransferase n=1 Tax=Shewanella sp. TC10 TaxID=1419739 RepID=UPI00129D4D21|nr:GNAT family N-acetyltransferase [Shewanella sp. TC10]